MQRKKEINKMAWVQNPVRRVDVVRGLAPDGTRFAFSRVTISAPVGPLDQPAWYRAPRKLRAPAATPNCGSF
jgi:hypothetical protein